MAGLVLSAEELRGAWPADAERGVQVAADGAGVAVEIEGRPLRRLGPRRRRSRREQVGLRAHGNNASCGLGARFGRWALIGRSNSRPSFGSGGGFGRHTCR